MRHLYADFIDRVAKPARYLGGEYQAVRQGPTRRGARVPRVPRRLRHRHEPPRHEDPLLAAQRAIRGSRASARSRRGSTWRPSCARAACRSCRSRAQRPLSRVRRRRLLAAVRADVHERAHDARPRRHPAARAPIARPTRPLVLAGGPTRHRTPSRWRAFFDAAFIGDGEEQLPRARARVGGAAQARPRRHAHARRRARRARDAFPRLRAVALRDRGRRRHRHDRRRRAARSARARCASSARWSRDLDAYPFPTTRRCRTPRPCSIACRSRSRAAAPRAAASARRA